MAGILSAQQFSGPVEGFIFDRPSQAFRAIIGIPGSASIGPDLVDGFDRGFVAPRKDYALAFQGDQCTFISGLNASVATASVPGVSGQVEGVVWSGDGSLAILYSRAGNWIQSLTGFPANPQANDLVDLSILGGSLSAVATDARGQNIAVGIVGANFSGVYLNNGSQGFTPILQISAPIALTFALQSNTLYALDKATLQIFEISELDFTSQPYVIDGLADPMAIEAARDSSGRSVLYLISGSDQIMRTYDTATHQVLADIPIGLRPTALTDLGPGSFVLASRAQSNDPLWLFATLPQPAVYFVPALASGGSE